MVANIDRDNGPADVLYASVSGAEDGPPVLLVHGLFGMGSNLGGLARALAPRFRVHQLDLPNHGRSPWQHTTTLATLADAVRDYAAAVVSGPVAIVGHSLGGKVAMELALSSPEWISAVVVADIAPVVYPGSHDQVFSAIAAVTDAEPRSRRDAAAIMEPLLDERGVAQFLLLSLRRDEDGCYRWRFNAVGLDANYDALRAAPTVSGPFNAPALFVYGEDSSYVREEGIVAARRHFSAARIVPIANAGHWLHSEQPEQFNAVVGDFLRDALLTERRES